VHGGGTAKKVAVAAPMAEVGGAVRVVEKWKSRSWLQFRMMPPQKSIEEKSAAAPPEPPRTVAEPATPLAARIRAPS
jgi:hypothetical protein